MHFSGVRSAETEGGAAGARGGIMSDEAVVRAAAARRCAEGSASALVSKKDAQAIRCALCEEPVSGTRILRTLAEGPPGVFHESCWENITRCCAPVWRPPSDAADVAAREPALLDEWRG